MMLPLVEDRMEIHFRANKQIKAKKRQLERVRRQRINERLEKLKIIVMKHLGNDVGFYPPMEKADILELAIRCLEDKQEATSPEEDKENMTIERKPLERLHSNTPSPSRKRDLEITPIRMKSFRNETTAIQYGPKTELNENSPCSAKMGQFRAEFKPLLKHPIRSFSVINKCDDVANVDQSRVSPTNINSIWRPWTL